MKTILQILYGKGLFDNYANADEALKTFLFTTTRLDSEEVTDKEIQ